MPVYQPCWNPSHAAPEPSAFREVAVPEEWKSLVRRSGGKGATGQWSSVLPESRRAVWTLCEAPVLPMSAQEESLLPDLNRVQPFSTGAVPPEGGSVRSEPHGQFPNPAQMSACCMQTVVRQTSALCVTVRKQGSQGEPAPGCLPQP